MSIESEAYGYSGPDESRLTNTEKLFAQKYLRRVKPEGKNGEYTDQQKIEAQKKALAELGRYEKFISGEVSKQKRKDFQKLNDWQKNLIRKQQEEKLKFIKEEAEFQKETTGKVNAETQKQLDAIRDSQKKVTQDTLKNVTTGVKVAGQVLSNLFDANKVFSVFQQYQTQVTDRLIGTGMDFDYLRKGIKNNLAYSAVVKQIDVLNKLATLVEKGIAQNVEERAFLATISEKIATTFDAFNPTMLKLIRIQQADSTKARLGFEANLNEYLNRYFGDSSYLSETFDGITSALYQVSSSMTSQASAEFEYVVQKWLGAYQSIGLSENTLNSIATAINYLGTGNISALSSNDALQRLLIMSINKTSGINYTDLLMSGLSANSVDKLMQGMTKYLSELANESNNVIRSTYANLFGFDISDLTAIKNLSQSQYESLLGNQLSYKDMLKYAGDRMDNLFNIQHMSAFFDNLLENAMFSVFSGVANNPVTYAMYRIAQMAESITGGMQIPEIGAFGTFFNLATSIEKVMKTSAVGVGALLGVIESIGGIGNAFSPLSGLAWNGSGTWADYSQTGALGVKGGTSLSGSMQTGSGSGMKEQVLSSATEEAKAEQGEDPSAKEQEKMIQNINDSISPSVQALLQLIQNMEQGVSSLHVHVDNTSSYYNELNSTI